MRAHMLNETVTSCPVRFSSLNLPLVSFAVHFLGLFDEIIVNDDLDVAYKQLLACIEKLRDIHPQ